LQIIIFMASFSTLKYSQVFHIYSIRNMCTLDLWFHVDFDFTLCEFLVNIEYLLF